MPEWVLRLQFAEQFHVHPDDVGPRTKVRTWDRWLEWQHARVIRSAFDHRDKNSAGNWGEWATNYPDLNKLIIEAEKHLNGRHSTDLF